MPATSAKTLEAKAKNRGVWGYLQGEPQREASPHLGGFAPGEPHNYPDVSPTLENPELGGNVSIIICVIKGHGLRNGLEWIPK
jgi:hypothetical protein